MPYPVSVGQLDTDPIEAYARKAHNLFGYSIDGYVLDFNGGTLAWVPAKSPEEVLANICDD